MSKLIQAGDTAKNIHLWTTASTKFSLFTATEQSPVLLAFFPCAFTKHDNKVLNGINDKYIKLFKDLNVRIIGISTDTHWTLDAYKNEKNIKFEMASDFNKHAAKAYGILMDKYSSYGYNGVAKEACILIAFDKRENKNFVEYMKVFDNSSDEFNVEKVANLIMNKWGKKTMPKSIGDKK
ncbi:unnamed protein product [Rotaria magnacalcarata]|uniref:Thioredoxin domain-containing protein n=3 Tax=Rotaria magnacalcarata TaxID=392030 RepID=A0A816QU84_9BILA|nr:unnamed protein product [Rotaria magnacalcarata]CAF1484967.1 unnamed protein product [Rotaria magnacalcarata]CAF1997945.1 unnamed protein product [Rotaria magnacalcarata]CAF2064676.1 unnamed protein product [Rotaria magnacalcarata]CAF2177374.1 unnamed protein product [Rotaria magnacalcarata]